MSNELEIMEKKAETEMAAIIKRAESFVVLTEEDYQAADAVITEVRGKVKLREEEWGEGKDLATKQWQWHCRIWKKYVTDPLTVCTILDKKRYRWRANENRKRQEAAEALRREEEKKQAEEKLKLAERMEAAGMKQQAEAVLDAPVAPVSVPEPVRVEKPEGQSYVENWQAKVVDGTKVPREFLTPDLVALGRYAKLMKGKASVPGVEFMDIGSVRRRL